METGDSQSTDPSKWALVTGASAGIGEEFCRQLAADGYHLVLVARRADRLHTLAMELRQRHGTACLILPTDLSEPGAATEIAKHLAKEEFKIEFLANNAGYGVTGSFTKPSWQTHKDFIQVMMTAVCELSWHLLPAMQENRRGYVINVASVAGLVPGTRGHTLYGASKSFLILFSESLALENQSHGVKVSALCPGFTYSEFHDVSGTREMMKNLPKFIWLSAGEVVRYGIESVRREKPRVIAIPGFLYRLVVVLYRYVPGFSYFSSRKANKQFRQHD